VRQIHQRLVEPRIDQELHPRRPSARYLVEAIQGDQPDDGLSMGVLSLLPDAIQGHRLTNRQLEAAAALVWAVFLILAALPWVL
jgi:hypothetical protein